jgi:hypothetical protein
MTPINFRMGSRGISRGFLHKTRPCATGLRVCKPWLGSFVYPNSSSAPLPE